MAKNIPMAIPAAVVQVLRYRREKTGVPMNKQVERLVMASVQAGELDAAKPAVSGGVDEKQA